MNGTARTTTSSLTEEQMKALGTSYKTFFSHTEETFWNYCYAYLLAAPSNCSASHLAVVRSDGFIAEGYYSNANIGVRPVMCLQSEVKLLETSKGSNIYNVRK